MCYCPRCGCFNDEVGWEPGSCVFCGLNYTVEQMGETWSEGEYSSPVWNISGPADPYICGENFVRAIVQHGLEMLCLFESGTPERYEFERGCVDALRNL